MDGIVSRLVICGAMAAVCGPACAELTPSIGLGTYRLADVVDPEHGMPGVAGKRSAGSVGTASRTTAGPDNGGALYSLEAAGAPVTSTYGSAADDYLAGQDRSWGITVGIEYGALTLRGAQQNRHVTNIRLYDQTGVNFDAKNSIAAANYRLSWGTAYAAYSASRGWGTSPLYNPDNPYSANIAGIGSNDSRDILAGVAVPMTRTTTFLASYIHKNDRELANRDANQIAFGASYTMSRRTDFYAAYSHIKNISGSSFSDAVNRSGSAINVGMRHAF
jgi:predicted porin